MGARRNHRRRPRGRHERRPDPHPVRRGRPEHRSERRPRQAEPGPVRRPRPAGGDPGRPGERKPPGGGVLEDALPQPGAGRPPAPPPALDRQGLHAHLGRNRRPRRAGDAGRGQEPVQLTQREFFIRQEPRGKDRFHGVTRAAPEAAEGQPVPPTRRPMHPSGAAPLQYPRPLTLRARPPRGCGGAPIGVIRGDPHRKILYAGHGGDTG